MAASLHVEDISVAGLVRMIRADIDAVVEALRQFQRAGFTDVALVQIGGDQQEAFLDVCSDLLPALNKAFT